eukprot:gene23719-29972_t
MNKSNKIINNKTPNKTTTNNSAQHAAPLSGSERRTFLGKEEIASLEQLESEAPLFNVRNNAAAEVVSPDWQRSTLNSHIDPPHLRLVIAVQINKIVTKLSFDQLAADDSHFNSGVMITIHGLVYSSIWPENAAVTESMMQVSSKYFNVSEYCGSHVTTIVRVKQSLDEMQLGSEVSGSVADITLQPRGVKEVGDRDLEVLPGICLIYRKSANWPPPPISQGVSITSHITLCPVVVSVTSAEAICRLRAFLEGAWDERWTSGEWDLSETAHQNIRVEGMHGTVSSDTTVTLLGVEVLCYPSSGSSSSSSSSGGVDSTDFTPQYNSDNSSNIAESPLVHPHTNANTNSTPKTCKQIALTVAPHTNLTLNISQVEQSMKVMLSELLTGSGSIHPTTTNVWDDSILGYFKRVVKKAIRLSTGETDSADADFTPRTSHKTDTATNNKNDSENTDFAQNDSTSLSLDIKLPHFAVSLQDTDSPVTLEPYSNQINTSICLDDQGTTVTDPDKLHTCDAANKHISSKHPASLSTKIHISNDSAECEGQSKVFVLDCESLDQKLLWLDALEPWLVNITNSGSVSGDVAVKKSLFRRLSNSVTGSGHARSTNSTTTEDPTAVISVHRSNSASKILKTANKSFKFFPTFTKKASKQNVMLETSAEPESNLDEVFISEFISQSEERAETTRGEHNHMLLQIKDTQRFVAEAVLLLNSLILTANKTRKLLSDSQLLGSRSLHDILSELQNEREKNKYLQAQYTKAHNAELELNYVLNACTMQHINTVQEMATRLDNAMVKFNSLRGASTQKGAASSSYGSSFSTGVNIHELVEHLTITVSETEVLLREADEKEKMLQQEL